MAQFGQILAELRKDAHLSQKELAALFSVSAGTISNYETGRYIPSFDTLIKLADYFDVSTDYLLGRTTSSISLNKLKGAYTPGKTLSDIIETLLSFDDENRTLISRVIEIVRVYNTIESSRRGR